MTTSKPHKIDIITPHKMSNLVQIVTAEIVKMPFSNSKHIKLNYNLSTITVNIVFYKDLHK